MPSRLRFSTSSGMKWRLTSISSATPWKARLIFDRDGGSGESARSDRDELQKCLQAMEHAKRSGRRQLCAGIGNRQFVGLILAEFLDGLTAVSA